MVSDFLLAIAGIHFAKGYRILLTLATLAGRRNDMTFDEQKAAVFEVALRIKRETSDCVRPAELKTIYTAMMEVLK